MFISPQCRVSVSNDRQSGSKGVRFSNCVKYYSQAIENEIKHPDEEEYAEQESRAFTMLYNAIKDDVMEKFAQEILDNLHGVLPF